MTGGDHVEPTRRLWSLWLQGEVRAPALVRTCLEGWRAQNPGWELTVLDAASLGDWIDPALLTTRASRLPVQKVSNLVRLDLLRRRGGVWVDATCLPRRPLDEWLPEMLVPSGFFAFRNPGPDRIVSSWFLAAARPGHVIPERMLAALRRYLLRTEHAGGRRHAVLARLEPRLGHSTRTSMLWTLPPLSHSGYRPYFSFHYLFGRLAYLDPRFRRAWRATPVLRASGPASPHSVLHHGYHRPVDVALQREFDEGGVPMYKLDWRQDPAAGPPDSALRWLLGEHSSHAQAVIEAAAPDR